MPQPVRAFHIFGDQFTDLDALPRALPASGYLWIATTRSAFEAALPELQAKLQAWTGAQLFDLHALDLLNKQRPSTFDYTSAYDLLVFRRLAAGRDRRRRRRRPAVEGSAERDRPDRAPARSASASSIASCSPSTRPTAWSPSLRQPAAEPGLRASRAAPAAHADLSCRPDAAHGQLHGRQLPELRRLLTKQLGELQEQLRRARRARRLAPPPRFAQRPAPARGHLRDRARGDHRVDRRARGVGPRRPPRRRAASASSACAGSRDVLEHIERVLSRVRRVEASSETAVQMHFSEQSNRTNAIMRTLTTLTAIFRRPPNLVNGFFGMNFEGLPLIHSPTGFWIIFLVMPAPRRRHEHLLLAQTPPGSLPERRLRITFAFSRQQYGLFSSSSRSVWGLNWLDGTARRHRRIRRSPFARCRWGSARPRCGRCCACSVSFVIRATTGPSSPSRRST